ncbi:MAG: N-acetylglucosamine-6-phosphate deacetylase [Phyllobacterium sp.]
MTMPFALAGARIFDGKAWHSEAALIVRDGKVGEIVSRGSVPPDMETTSLNGGMLVPGFIDIQVNGGGGVLLNEEPNVDGIRTICAAHLPFGTTGLLPTLITDTPEITSATIAAGEEATRERVPGFLGLHLEGPHLSLTHKGTHHPALIRPMDNTDLAKLLAAASELPVLLVTVAPETVTADQISAMADAGIIVSLGHSGSTYDIAANAAKAGATMVTHLFNAMSQMSHRSPNMVGAALETGSLYAGLIADGFHVDRPAMAIALRAKKGPGKVFLVTDAMSPIGTDITSFTLNGRLIKREGGRLTLEDGTLAGADLDMISAVRFIHREIGLELDEALRMASLYPAEAIGLDRQRGRLLTDFVADIVHLSDDLDVEHVWQDGQLKHKT